MSLTKLRYTPTFYQDELFYSWFCRFTGHSLISIHLGKQKLFGASDFGLSLRFLERPSRLAERGVFSQSDINKLIERNTLLHYFLQFIEFERRGKIVENLWSRDPINSSLENDLGFNRAAKGLLSVPKYCPLCNRESMEKFGEIYWNRLHQIPDIQICTQHNCFLENCIDTINIQKKYHLIFPLIDKCPIQEPKFNDSKDLSALGKCCVELLKGEYKIDLDYTQRARELGYGFWSSNKVDQIALEKEFKEFYLKTFFREVSYTSLLFIRYKITNPYRHIMLDYFLTKKKERDGVVVPLNKIKFWDRGYFGEGPWSCINSKCQNFGKKIISKADFKYDSKAKKTVGLFSCGCGSLYTKSFLIEGDVIIRTIVKKIQISKRGKKLRKLNNSQNREEKSKQKEWMQLKSAVKLTKELKRRLYFLTTQLKKSDSKWVARMQKEVKKKKSLYAKKAKTQNIRYQRGELLAAVEFFKKHPPPFRITKPQILRQSKLTFAKIDPSLRGFLSEHVEPLVNFQIRRLNIVALKLLNEGEKLTPSKLLFKAHIWKKSRRVEEEAIRICKNSLQ